MLHKFTFCVTLCLLACLRAGAQDQPTPEAAVRAFLTAFGQGDIKAAALIVKGVKMDAAAMDALAQQVKKEPAKITLTDAKTTLNGNSAVLTGQVSLTTEKVVKPQTSPTELNLVLSEGVWQIVPDAAKAQRATNPDLANGLALMLTDSKVFTRARDSARDVVCLSNMKQVCLAALMFLQDYDERFKLKAESYKKSLMPYVKNEAVFKCPADTTAGPSYAFNTNLVGISAQKIHVPAETVMIYEGKAGKLNFRHAGKATVGFADGHARLVDAAAAKKLRWKP